MTPEVPRPRAVESPCVKVCRLDARNICIGCGRTLAEIACWSRMTAAERQQACERAARRREGMNGQDQ